ncbi:hypothetical protein YC2023_025223 [Brassica napus]
MNLGLVANSRFNDFTCRVRHRPNQFYRICFQFFCLSQVLDDDLIIQEADICLCFSCSWTRMQLRNRRLLLSKKKRHLLLPSQGSPVNLPSKSWLQRFCMQMSDVSKVSHEAICFRVGWSMFCFIDMKEDSLLGLHRVKSQSVSEESLKDAPVPAIVYENSINCDLFIVEVE